MRNLKVFVHPFRIIILFKLIQKIDYNFTLSCILISIVRFSRRRRAVSAWPAFVAAKIAVIFFIPILLTLALYFNNKSTILV
jgi:hypothetical protein